MSVIDKTALVLLAAGAEEMEVSIIVDVLRRGGLKGTLAGVAGSGPVVCSRGPRPGPDAARGRRRWRVVPVGDVAGSFDAVVLPGGAQGAENLGNSPLVGRHLKTQWQRGRVVAAVCAAPLALLRHEIGLGQTLTSHPSVADSLRGAYTYSTERVVESGVLITSQGPGTCFEFGLKLLRRLR